MRIIKLAKFFYDQTFSHNEDTWDVPDIFDYAKENKSLINIDIKDLLNNLEPSPYETGDDIPGSKEFVERANKSDLSYPIIVVEYPDGLFIADGVHRLWKAKDQGLKQISAYLISQKELLDITRAKKEN